MSPEPDTIIVSDSSARLRVPEYLRLLSDGTRLFHEPHWRDLAERTVRIFPIPWQQREFARPITDINDYTRHLARNGVFIKKAVIYRNDYIHMSLSRELEQYRERNRLYTYFEAKDLLTSVLGLTIEIAH